MQRLLCVQVLQFAIVRYHISVLQSPLQAPARAEYERKEIFMIEHIFHFCGPITPKSYENFRNMVLTAMCQQGAEKITIMFSSEGGDLNSGFSAYNFLRGLPVPVRMVNVGTVESIAVIMYLAADERDVLDNARFLLHQFNWTYPFQRVDYARLNENSESLKFDFDRYVSIFNDRTQVGNGAIDITKCLNGQAIVINSSSSTASGIATKVIPVEGSIPLKTDTTIHWWCQTCF